MFYAYKCENEKCVAKDKEVSINKPISECGREELCKECNEPMNRIYNIAGHQTFGDGYKG